jgi:tetratricopeptide (TPR) repeat protein
MAKSHKSKVKPDIPKALARLLVAVALLSACQSEILQKQAEQIKQQEEELASQRKELEALKLAQQQETEKRQSCNRAFRDFEKAQATKDPEQAIALYRQGVKLCPDDDVARFELGKLLSERGRKEEARKELEAALKINPDFTAAKRLLEELTKAN